MPPQVAPADRFRRPSGLLFAAEAVRAATELVTFAVAMPVLHRGPDGDHRPVLVLPGFTASDRSTEPLRWFLRDHGYDVSGWDLGCNIGPTRRILDGLQRRLLRMHDRTGEPVTLIGWSLGGIYARALAELFPQAVRQVITLGSPVRLSDSTNTNASSLYDAMSELHVRPEHNELFTGKYHGAPSGVPCTSIYTRTDGVVPWESCVDDSSDLSENVEVHGSHMGLGHNPAALLVVADRLRQPSGAWRRFRPGLLNSTVFPAHLAA